MTTSIASLSASQSALQVNGITSVIFDQNGIVSGVDGGIKPVTASVAANALTIGINPCSTQFRSTVLTGSGLPVQVANSAALTLFVPFGATLGTISAVQSQIIILEINNAGTKELAVVNLAGGNDLSETGLINTTAITSGATAANVIYSQTARTGVAYRVVGSITSTQTTSGTWAQALVVTGEGGQALAAMSSLGYGQTWQNVTGSRAISTTYYNTTGKPIYLCVNTTNLATGGVFTIVVNGLVISTHTAGSSTDAASLSCLIAASSSYSVTLTVATVLSWFELR